MVRTREHRLMAVAFLKIVGNILGALWIVGGTMFFFVRFSMVFYHTHQTALEGLWHRLW